MIAAIKRLHHFANDPLSFMQASHEKYGDFFSLYLGPKKFHFINHPDLAEMVLNSRSDHFQKSRLIFDKIIPITGKNGLVQLEGERWQEIRRITSEVFHKHYLDRYIKVIDNYVDNLIVELKDQADRSQSIDISSMMVSYTMNIAVKIFLGDFQHALGEKIAENFIKLNSLCGCKMRHIITMPFIFPTRLNNEIKGIRQQLAIYIDQLIDSSTHRDDLNLLANLQLKLKNHYFANQLIKDQIMTFLFASYETTAASLTFCLYLLAKFPEYQQKIRAELSQNSAIQTMSVYREALRLYPPAYMLAREVIDSITIDERLLKKKDNVIVSVYGIHRHKAIWSNPNEFIPERFSSQQEKKLNKFAYIPFGYGKRVCSGMQLAMIEAELVLKKLLKHFHFTLLEDKELSLETMVTLHPKESLRLQIKAI